MARPVYRFDSKSARSALSPRREPYWTPITGPVRGRFIGYRKMPQKGDPTATKSERWVVRARDEETGEQHYGKLGKVDEAKLGYHAACKKAQEWFAALDEGVVTSGKFTVEMACKEYEEHLRREKGEEAANDAKWRFKRSGIYGGTKLGRTEVTKLRAVSVREWRAKLGEKDAKERQMAKSG